MCAPILGACLATRNEAAYSPKLRPSDGGFPQSFLRLIRESKQYPTQRERVQATESAPAMGFGRTGPVESQQGRLRRGQQAGPNRLGELG